MKQTLIIYFRAWILSCLLAPRLFGATIYGELTRYGVYGNTETIPFKVALSTNLQLWQITVLYTNQQDTCGTDGQKTCYIRKLSKEALQVAGIPEAIPQATIVNGVFPGVSGQEVRMVWLAFASSSFFTVQTNPLICLWRGGSGADTAPDYGVKIEKIEFLNSLGRLPAKIDFTFSGDQLLSLTNFAFLSFKERNQSRIQESAMANKIHEGELLAEYSTKNVTNFNGLLLPLEFDFNLLSARGKLFHGRVINVTDETPDSFLPSVKERLYTSDYRFSDEKSMVDYIKYKIVDQTWPSTNDPALQTLFEDEKQKLPPPVADKLIDNSMKATQMKAMLVRIILLLVMLALPVFLYSYLKQTKSTKER